MLQHNNYGYTNRASRRHSLPLNTFGMTWNAVSSDLNFALVPVWKNPKSHIPCCKRRVEVITTVEGGLNLEVQNAHMIVMARCPQIVGHIVYLQDSSSQVVIKFFSLIMQKNCYCLSLGFTSPEKSYDKEFLIRRAATNRVLNVLRHWVSKHSQVRFIFIPIIFITGFTEQDRSSN